MPTIAEALPLPGYAVNVWQGVLAPAGTPKEIINTLNREIIAVLKNPEDAAKLVAVGLEPIPTTPEHFAEIMKSDQEKWTKVVQSTGIGIH